MRTSAVIVAPQSDETAVAPRTVLWWIALLALGARIALEMVGLLSQAMHDRPVAENFLSLWWQWDGHHYLRIAQEGYPADPTTAAGGRGTFNLGFFPGFPIAVRLVAVVVRDRVVSGFFVSYVASVFASWFLYLLVRLEGGHEQAWRAVLLLLAFPTAYFLAAPYSEALFLCAVTGSIYAARTGRWALSGLVGVVATGTRLVGLALLPALGAEALRGRTGGRQRVLRLTAAVSTVSGFAAFLAISQIVANDPLHYFALQRTHWHQTTVLPWEPFRTAIMSLIDGTSSSLTFVFATRLAAATVAVPLLVLAVRRLPVPDSIYGWAAFVPLLFTGWLTALPRFLLGVYPLFVVGAQLTRARRVLVPVLAVGAATQAFLFWRFSVGEWTF